MLQSEFLTRTVNVLPLFWFVLTFSQNFAKPYGDDEEPFHRGAEGKGQMFEPTVEYDEETYPVHKPRTQATIRADLIRNEIIPEFFLIPPKLEAFITYYNGSKPDMGNTLRPDQVKWCPHTVTYKFEPDTLYTLVMTGLDEPSKATPTKREFLHWIVGNIPADSCLAGDQITEYYPVLPKKDTGLHRYLYLIYKQKAKIDFNEPPLTNRNDFGRANWSSKKFAEKYKLGDPYAVNFFCSEYTDHPVFTPSPKPYRTSLFYPPTNEPH